MVKGLNIQCRNCNKIFWVELKLKFGVRKNIKMPTLLECFLDESRFYFKCPYCKKPTIVGVTFFCFKSPEITQIVENPDYIG